MEMARDSPGSAWEWGYRFQVDLDRDGGLMLDLEAEVDNRMLEELASVGVDTGAGFARETRGQGVIWFRISNGGGS